MSPVLWYNSLFSAFYERILIEFILDSFQFLCGIPKKVKQGNVILKFFEVDKKQQICKSTVEM